MVGEWAGMGGSAEDRQLELTLGPPGCDRSWGGPVAREVVHQNKEEGSSSSTGLSLGLFSKCPKSSSCSSAGGRRGFVGAADETSPGGGYETMLQRAEQDVRNAGVGNGDVKPCSTPPAVSVPTSADGAVAQARSQARSTTGTAPVVGWPPIRSFRKNIAIATSSRLAQASKPAGATGGSDPQQQQQPQPENPVRCCSSSTSSSKGVFVKINMEGIPIGRKVDLKACDGYDGLSATVDKLFRGLLMAAQKEPHAASSAPNSAAGEGAPVITGLLDGTGEYTLVYEDEEGDRILVGDVPWEMFVSTAKRLRVLKTSDLSKLSLGATSRKRAAPESSGVC